MMKHEVGCLVVVVDRNGRFRGVLTECHLVGGLVAEQTCPLDRCTAARLNDRITRKVIALSEIQMKASGWGPPPVDYCWLNMGSAARHEQTLRTDQDNAITYADPEQTHTPEAFDYFQRLASLLVDGLVRCGFERCSGGAMATHPKWCRTISAWRQGIAGWMTSNESALLHG